MMTGEGHTLIAVFYIAALVLDYVRAPVRRYETELHLSPEDALNDATNQEEAENAPRLREVVTHHKTQQFYSEEGYEDSAYDHGGYDKHGEHHEVAPGWEMTAVRLARQAAKSPPDKGSNEEEGGEEEEEDDDDHNAEGSNPKANAVAAPNANRPYNGAPNATREVRSFQNVLADGKNQASVADIRGNFSKPTEFATFPSSDSILPNSTHRPFSQEQIQIETLLRAFKVKEKDHRLVQKWHKQRIQKKKRKNRLSRKLEEKRNSSRGGFDIRDNEIKQPRSNKDKKLRKEQKKSKRLRALMDRQNKFMVKSGLAVDISPINTSSRAYLGVQKGSIDHSHGTKVTNKTDRESVQAQATDAASKRAIPLKSVMKNPFSMYHRDPLTAEASISGLEGFGKDVFGQTPVRDVTHSKLWGLVPPWESYGRSKQISSIRPDSLFRPLPIGLLAITYNAEVGSNDGLATIFQPIRNTMEGFLDTTGRIGAWGRLRDQRDGGKLEKRRLNTTTTEPKFVLPGQGNLLGRFPKTEAILQMETRALSKLRKTHNITELPSNIKHVKPLIGVSSSKSGKLFAKQIKIVKDIDKRSSPKIKIDSSAMKSDSVFPIESTFDDFRQRASEPINVARDRAVYIANLTENHLTMKNFSWPPQVIVSPPTKSKVSLEISQQQHKAVNPLTTNTPHRKTRRNVSYQSQKPHKNIHRGALKFKRDNRPTPPKRSSQLRIDEKKYPFYLATPSEHLARYSPLRYAVNPLEIPAKTGGGMEFYESREKYKRCKEVQSPDDPVPERTSDGQWVQNSESPDGPRISGLGEVISCLREKLFGKDPLDNPLFHESRVGLPADTSLAGALFDGRGSPAPEKNDPFEFYKDVIRHIDKSALRPLRNNVPDNSYVYIGKKPIWDSQDAHRSPAHYAATQYFHLNSFDNLRKAKKDYFQFGNGGNIPQKLPGTPLEAREGRENGEKSERLNLLEDKILQEPPINQQYFDHSVPVHDTAVDPHTPLKISENTKKYLDEFLNDLVKPKDSNEIFSSDSSQAGAQKTQVRIAHSDSIYQPVVATKMHPPVLSILKYKSMYTNNAHPYTRLGSTSHEKLLSSPKAKYVLRDTGAKEEVFQSSESKDPIRSQIESNPNTKVHEHKKITSSETIVHSSSFNFDQPFSTQNPNPPLLPSKTAEIAHQEHDATKEPQPVTVTTQTSTPSGKSEFELIGKDIHEPSASVITPLSTSHPPRLPEPIYHAVRGVGGIKAYHVGMNDDSVIEIPTPNPQGNKWRYRPEGHSEGTEGSAQQSDEDEQLASNERELHEGQVPYNNNPPNESQYDYDDHKDKGNTNGHDTDQDNTSADQNEDNSVTDDNKNDDESDTKQNDNHKSSVDNDDDKGDNDAAKTEENEASENDDSNKSDAHMDEDKDTEGGDAVKPEENEAPENDDSNKSDMHQDKGKDTGDDDTVNSEDNEAPEHDDHNENDEDKNNNDGKPDFDDWFKESPYKVNDKDDYNVDWDDSKPKFHVPFSKEWHKELGGINDEFKDDKDNDEDGVGKHVEKLFDDDKGHDAYLDINTEPPAPASGEEGHGDENEAENTEASQQDPQKDTSAQNAPSNEDDQVASPQKGDKDEDSTNEEAGEDVKQSPKEADDGSNAAEENLSPAEDEQTVKKKVSEEPNSHEEPPSAVEPKKWESLEQTRPAKKTLKDQSVHEAPSQESGGTGNDDGYDPAGYEKPGDEREQSDEAGTEESQQSSKKAKIDEFWTDKDDFGAPPGAKIRVVEHDASFGDIDDSNDDDDLSSQKGRKTTRRGKHPDNLSITTTNSQVRSKGFDTGVNKRRATSHQKKARPIEENTDTTSSGEDMDGDFATNPKIQVLHPVYRINPVWNPLNVTTVEPSPLP